jgi:hypothetical protein
VLLASQAENKAGEVAMHRRCLLWVGSGRVGIDKAFFSFDLESGRVEFPNSRWDGNRMRSIVTSYFVTDA